VSPPQICFCKSGCTTGYGLSLRQTTRARSRCRLLLQTEGSAGIRCKRPLAFTSLLTQRAARAARRHQTEPPGRRRPTRASNRVGVDNIQIAKSAALTRSGSFAFNCLASVGGNHANAQEARVWRNPSNSVQGHARACSHRFERGTLVSKPRPLRCNVPDEGQHSVSSTEVRPVFRPSRRSRTRLRARSAIPDSRSAS
jgi:hypothetical protein